MRCNCIAPFSKFLDYISRVMNREKETFPPDMQLRWGWGQLRSSKERSPLSFASIPPVPLFKGMDT